MRDSSRNAVEDPMQEARRYVDNAREAAVSQRDAKLLTLFMEVYRVAHLSMGYDGVQDREVCRCGLRLAESLIDRCALLLC